MKKRIIILLSLLASCTFYACKNGDDNGVTIPTPTTTQLTSTLISQVTSGSTTTGSGTFTGSLNGTSGGSLSGTSQILSYTVTFADVTPTAISLDPVSTSGTSGSTTSGTNYSNSILLAGSFPTSISTPGSGTLTNPGSGTSSNPGSGTLTNPGSGTSSNPGSGTLTDPGSGTSSNPGSGTSTNPGSGTGIGSTISSPLSGTTAISSTRADSLTRGLYRINIRTSAYPSGAVGGVIQTR